MFQYSIGTRFDTFTGFEKVSIRYRSEYVRIKLNMTETGLYFF